MNTGSDAYNWTDAIGRSLPKLIPVLQMQAREQQLSNALFIVSNEKLFTPEMIKTAYAEIEQIMEQKKEEQEPKGFLKFFSR